MRYHPRVFLYCSDELKTSFIAYPLSIRLGAGWAMTTFSSLKSLEEAIEARETGVSVIVEWPTVMVFARHDSHHPEFDLKSPSTEVLVDAVKKCGTGKRGPKTLNRTALAAMHG